MRTTSVTALLTLLALLVIGCEPNLVAPTQVLVTIRSDIGSALARVETAVYDAREQQVSDTQTYAVPAEVSLPFSFAIVPALNRPQSTVLVVVTGRDAQGTLLAQAKAFVTFQDNKRIAIEVSLLAACLQRECGALQTCTVSSNVGTCGIVEEPPATPVDEEMPMTSAHGDASVGMVVGAPGGGAPGVGAGDAGGDAMVASDPDGGGTRDGGPSDAGIPPREASTPVSDASSAPEAGLKDATIQDATMLEAGPGSDAATSPFPRLDQPANITMTGPYNVSSYTDGIDSASYTNPIVYYPANAAPPFAAVALMHGYIQTRSTLMAWGPFLASHGIVTMLVDTSSQGDQVPDRADDLDAQLATLRAENSRAGSPLRNKVDGARLGLFGFSMGAGAALVAASRDRTQVQAVVAFEPWSGSASATTFPQITADTLIFGGSADSTAPPAQQAEPTYQSITAAKVYVEVAGIGHAAPAVSETSPARMIVAWFKIALEGDTRYETYISGAKRDEISSQITKSLTANR